MKSKLFHFAAENPNFNYFFLFTFKQIFEDNCTRSCFKGIATHWYYDYVPFIVERIQDEFCEKYPEQILLPTESSVCEEDFNYFFTNDWEKAVRYAKDIILVNAYVHFSDNLCLNPISFSEIVTLRPGLYRLEYGVRFSRRAELD